MSRSGDISNLVIPRETVKRGGAATNVHGAKRAITLMVRIVEDGPLRILNECDLPYTGELVVQRIITDLAVVDVTLEGPMLVELAPDVSEDKVRQKAEPELLR